MQPQRILAERRSWLPARGAGLRSRAYLVVVMAVAVGLRLVWIVLGRGAERFTNVDSSSYLAFAAVLPNELINPPPEVLDSSLQRSPGYPALIWVTGAAHGSPLWLLVAQCLLGGVIVVGLTYLLARRMVGPRAALVAAALVAVDPVSIGHSLLIGTETLFTATLLGSVVLLWIAHERSAHGRPIVATSVAAGAVIGAAALIRPQIVYLLPIAAVGAGALAATPTGSVRKAAVSAVTATCLVLVGSSVVVAPWVVRNAVLTDRLLVSTAEGQNLAELGAACMEATDSGVAWWPEPVVQSHDRQDRALRRFEQRYLGDVDSLDAVGRHSEWSSGGRRAILDNPGGCLQVMGAGLVRVLFGPGDAMLIALMGPDEPAVARPALRVIAIGALAVQLALAAAGAAALGLHRRWAVVSTLAVPIVVYLVTSAGPQLYARFRVPVVPYLAVLAGVGAVGLFDRLSGRTEGQPETGATPTNELDPATPSGVGSQLEGDPSTPSA